MRVIPAKGLSTREAPFFLSEEMRDLQEPDEDPVEAMVGVQSGSSAQTQVPLANERIPTLRRGVEEEEAIEGLENPIRLIPRKSGVGTAELLLDELEGTFQPQSIGRTSQPTSFSAARGERKTSPSSPS